MDNFNLQKWVAKRASSLQSNRPVEEAPQQVISIKRAVNQDDAIEATLPSRGRQGIPPLSSKPPVISKVIARQEETSPMPKARNVSGNLSKNITNAQPSATATSGLTTANSRTPVLKAGERLGSKSNAEKDIRTGKARNLYAKEPSYSASAAKLSPQQSPSKTKSPPTIKNETKILGSQLPLAQIVSSDGIGMQGLTLAQALEPNENISPESPEKDAIALVQDKKAEFLPVSSQKEIVATLNVMESAIQKPLVEKSEADKFDVNQKILSNDETSSTEVKHTANEEGMVPEVGDEISKIAKRIQDKIDENSLNEKSSLADLVSEEEKTSPLHQIQIVKLLSDLGDRLRQSEREREILWKEVESCRKHIDGLDDKNAKTEAAYKTLKEEATAKENQIKGLIDKQSELNVLLEKQKQQFDAGQEEHKALRSHLEEKLNTIETSTGSAIVRVEDAIAENSKLSKRIEQLGQDKARLLHKLDLMEETLTQTQDALKAKALVLLTDQAIANQTNLPQAAAWSGDDTLKLSRGNEGVVQAENVAVGITASFRKDRAQDGNQVARIIALLLLGLASGLLLSSLYLRYVVSSNSINVGYSQDEKLSDTGGLDESMLGAQKKSLVSGLSDAKIENDREGHSPLMSQIATIANQIEPGSLDNSVDIIVGNESEFKAAIEAEKKALENFRQSSTKTSASGRIKGDHNLPELIYDIEQRALDGDGQAQYQLANLYLSGKGGVTQNLNRAYAWFSESAQHNIPSAIYNLAVLTAEGKGGQKDIARAMDLYRVAASYNYPHANYNLAIAYIDGIGVEYNPAIAYNYFQRAAAGGIADAAYNLGLLNENGLLGESQPDEAIFWYKLAANSGNVQATEALGELTKQLSLSEDEVTHIIKKISESHPGFLNARGIAELPKL